jgi:hypothetical protein
MSLGPRMQDEASLAAQVQRAALFSTFAKATDMEKSLVRAVTPVVSVTRLVYSGHGQFSYRGHAIGVASDGMENYRERAPRHLRPRGELPSRPWAFAYPVRAPCFGGVSRESAHRSELGLQLRVGFPKAPAPYTRADNRSYKCLFAAPAPRTRAARSRAAQFPPRTSRRAAASTYRANSVTPTPHTSSSYPPPCSVAAFVVNSEPHTHCY